MKYQTKEFVDSFSYTNYSISVEEIGKIKETSFNNLPEYIKVNDVSVPVYGVGGFIPPESIYLGENIWERRGDWFIHTQTRLKVKEEVRRSPDFNKSHGTRTTKLIAKIPIKISAKI